ncbi:sulfite exporter TauE/SafE family protein [Hominifimenecus sp. rT4P-3]|uniref:sulfite exporter TauE/SafE family protein n=1 Tax=Hominifimenecus sp. rT4P-3 TaxID=3242979 RepID=UPI003DA2D14A
MEYAIILLAAAFGGLINVLTGFGCGIVVMVFLPYLFPLPHAASISNVISLCLITSFAIKYRKQVKISSFPVPFLCYALTAALAITISARIHAAVLKPYFGLFLIVVAIYFAFVAPNLKLTANGWTAAICALLSGLSQGFFGISGPPMALYFLLISETKEQYIGNLQVFSLFTSVFALGMRIYSGTFHVSMLPMAAIGVVGVFLGKAVGMRISVGIDMERMKKIVYLFLGISGFWTFISNL